MPNYHLRAFGWFSLALLFVVLGAGSLAENVSWAGYAWLAIAVFYVVVALLALRKASQLGGGPPPNAPGPSPSQAGEQEPPPAGEGPAGGESEPAER